MLRPTTAYECSVFVGVFVIMTYCASLEFVLICTNTLKCGTVIVYMLVYGRASARKRKNSGSMQNEHARVLDSNPAGKRGMCKHNQYSTCAGWRSHLCCSTGDVVVVCARASRPCPPPILPKMFRVVVRKAMNAKKLPARRSLSLSFSLHHWSGHSGVASRW